MKCIIYFENFHGQLKTKTVKTSGDANAEQKFLAWTKKQKRGDMLDVIVTAIQMESPAGSGRATEVGSLG